MGSGFREARTVIMIVSIDCGAPMPCGAGSISAYRGIRDWLSKILYNSNP